MKRIMIASPHPDDAFLSLGASIIKAKKHSILIWDIFTIQDYTIQKEFRKSARIKIIEEEKEVSRRTHTILKLEELPEAGLRGYGRLSEMLHCDWPAWEYKTGEREIYNKIIESFTILENQWQPDWIGIPLCCGRHIDHIMVREALFHWLKSMKSKSRPKAFLYEDLPYARNKQWSLEAIEECRSPGWELKECLLSIGGFIAEKESLISMYKSQIKKRDVLHIVSYAGSFKKKGEWERVWIIR
jgi:LmbE family N-acetylglucosaminyl deacetylase